MVCQELQRIEDHILTQKSIFCRVKRRICTRRSFFHRHKGFPSQNSKLLIILSCSRNNKSYHVFCFVKPKMAFSSTPRNVVFPLTDMIKCDIAWLFSKKNVVLKKIACCWIPLLTLHTYSN